MMKKNLGTLQYLIIIVIMQFGGNFLFLIGGNFFFMLEVTFLL